MPARGARTSERGASVLVTDRRAVGGTATTANSARQLHRMGRQARKILPPSGAGCNSLRGSGWDRVAAVAGGVSTGVDGVRNLRPLGPRRCMAAHPRHASRPAPSAGRTRPVPDRGDRRLADRARSRHGARISSRMGRREANESGQAAHCGGCQRATAHGRGDRRLDPGSRRRAPATGRTEGRLLHYPAHLGRRRLPRPTARLGEKRSRPAG